MIQLDDCSSMYTEIFWGTSGNTVVRILTCLWSLLCTKISVCLVVVISSGSEESNFALVSVQEKLPIIDKDDRKQL